MNRFAVFTLVFLLGLGANVVSLYFIPLKPVATGIVTVAPTTGPKTVPPGEVAKTFYQALQQGKYDQIYNLMHPQVQEQISRADYVKKLQAALKTQGLVITSFKLSTERTYEMWRSPFASHDTVYRDVREISVVLNVKQRSKQCPLSGVILLTRLTNGEWRIIKM